MLDTITFIYTQVYYYYDDDDDDDDDDDAKLLYAIYR